MLLTYIYIYIDIVPDVPDTSDESKNNIGYNNKITSLTCIWHCFHLIGYVNTLLEVTWSIYTGEADVLAVNPFNNPPPLCSSFQHPVKAEAVQKHRSRFNLTI